MSTTATPFAAAAVAALREAEGMRVAEHDGVLWSCRRMGFWTPVDFLAPLPASIGPVRGTGFHHVLRGDSDRYIPLTVVEHVETYSTEGLRRKVRQDVAASHRRADITTCSDPEVLLREAYPIWQEAAARSGQRIPSTTDRFHRLIDARWRTPHQFVVVGSQHGRLGGFLTAHLIGDRCYFDEVVIADAARQWRLGTGMYDVALHVARDLGATTVLLGIWAPDIPHLDDFKVRMGAVNRLYPAHSRIAGGLHSVIRRMRPLTHARLYGVPDADACAALAPGRPLHTLPIGPVES